MAYTGFVSDNAYTRYNREETITHNWTFNTKTTFKNGMKVTGMIEGTAQYANWADLAENYKDSADEFLIPGTLVKFGGKQEITKTKPNDRHFFGVISTKPGMILNQKEKDAQKVALVGRVPVRTIGIIHKFDKLTTSKNYGVAKRKTLLDTLLLKPTVGIALETNTNSKEKLVECFTKANI